MQKSSPIKKIWHLFLGYYFPKKLADLLYLREFEKKLNWENPQDLNEKINWIAFNTDTNKWSYLSDKYRVRDYVISKGFEYLLPKLYGVWDSVKAINFELLPQKFVIKCNHDAGNVIMVNNKVSSDIFEIKKKLSTQLKLPFGLKTAEPHYLRIKRKVIAEEFIENDNEISNSLVDYKFWTFHGRAYCCYVIYNKLIFNERKSDIYFLPDWEQANNKLIGNNVYSKFPPPKKLPEMIEIVEKLSSNFYQCRVDLYYSNDKIYFGEMTFTSACGRIKNYTKEFLIELGDNIDLNYYEGKK